MRAAELEEADASLLFPAMLGGSEESDRLKETVAWIRQRLGAGALLYRYRGEDGLDEEEGLSGLFVLVGRRSLASPDEAAALMEELLRRSNDVGLYAEEIDPASDRFLGNFPQGLVHLALINAAVTLNGRTGQ